jgi:hypothetical protein
MATAEPAYDPSIGNLTAPIVIDATGLTTTVPLLIKNGKSQSGVVAQVTGTVATGFALNNSSGTAVGAFGYAVSANDWITQSLAGDTVLLGGTSTFLRIGVIGAATPVLSVDYGNARVGIGTNAPSHAIHILGATTATARVEVVQATASSQAIVECNTGSCFASLRAHGATTAGTSLGANLTGTGACLASPTAVGFLVGSQTAFPLIFGTNDTEKARIPSAGGLIVGTAALATTATDGFLYIPSCAGTPTGVPTTATGRVAMIYDTTNDKFYIYNGSWKGGTVPGIFI